MREMACISQSRYAPDTILTTVCVDDKLCSSVTPSGQLGLSGPNILQRAGSNVLVFGILFFILR